ncbi:MAG: alpha/beta hydrolase [Dehalococcoidia bacterium]|nr:alpha/beta hydrolase [Dehalococcoidia bacterium]
MKGLSVPGAGARLSALRWDGDGPPILCLHGQTANAQSFSGLAARLAPEFTVVAVDLRGRGESEKPPIGYGYQVHVADVVHAISGLGLAAPAPVLVGHSWGAIIALCVAAWYPDAARALVLIDGGGPVPESIVKAVDQIVARLDAVYPTKEQYLNLMAAAPWLQPWTPALADQFSSLLEPTPGGFRARAPAACVQQDVQLYAGGPPDYPTLWKQVTCPTLIVRAAHGFYGLDADHVLPEETFQAMVAAIPNAQGVVVDANHYTVVMGDPVETADAIARFVRDLPPVETAHEEQPANAE